MVSNQSCDLNFNGNWWRIRSQSSDSLNTDHNHFRVSTVGRATTDNTALRHSKLDTCGDMLAGQQGFSQLNACGSKLANRQGFTVSWIPVVSRWPADKGSQSAEYLWCCAGRLTRVHRQLDGYLWWHTGQPTKVHRQLDTCSVTLASHCTNWISCFRINKVLLYCNKGSQAAGYLWWHASWLADKGSQASHSGFLHAVPASLWKLANHKYWAVVCSVIYFYYSVKAMIRPGAQPYHCNTCNEWIWEQAQCDITMSVLPSHARFRLAPISSDSDPT